MIVAVEKAFRLSRHQPFSISVKFSEEGVPVDITGWTVKMSVAETEGAAPSLVATTGSTTAGGSGVTLTPAEGLANILISKADNETLNATGAQKQLVYDIMAGPSGGVERYYFGSYTLDAGVGT